MRRARTWCQAEVRGSVHWLSVVGTWGHALESQNVSVGHGCLSAACVKPGMLKGTCLRAHAPVTVCLYLVPRRKQDVPVCCLQRWGRREALRPCTDQHVLLRADYQLLGRGGHLLFTLMRGSVVPVGPTLRNQEGPGDLGLEVVQDFRGVGQLQMADGEPVTQHLEATEVVGLGGCVAQHTTQHVSSYS